MFGRAGLRAKAFAKVYFLRYSFAMIISSSRTAVYRFPLTRLFLVIASLILFTLAACEQPFGTDSGSERSSTASSSDGGGDTAVTTTSEGFLATFLPPIAEDPAPVEESVTGLDPVVRVRSLGGDSNEDSVIAEFTTSGSGSQRVRKSFDSQYGDYYIVNFHLPRFELQAGTRIAIEVVVDGEVSGAVEAQVVANGREAREVTGALAFVSNRTVPVKFQIRATEVADPQVPPAVSAIARLGEVKEKPLSPPADTVSDTVQEYELRLVGSGDPADDDSLFVRAIGESDLPDWVTITDSNAGIVRVDSTGLPAGNRQTREVSFYTSFNEDRKNDQKYGSTHEAPLVVTFTVEGPRAGE